MPADSANTSPTAPLSDPEIRHVHHLITALWPVGKPGTDGWQKHAVLDAWHDDTDGYRATLRTGYERPISTPGRREQRFTSAVTAIPVTAQSGRFDPETLRSFMDHAITDVRRRFTQRDPLTRVFDPRITTRMDDLDSGDVFSLDGGRHWYECAETLPHAVRIHVTPHRCGERLTVTLPATPDQTCQVWWPGAGPVYCEYEDALYNHAVLALQPTYALVAVAPGDTLSPSQITALLTSPSGARPRPFTALNTWAARERTHAANRVILDLLGPAHRDYLNEVGLLDDLRAEVIDRDTSDPTTDLLTASPRTPFRYDLRLTTPNPATLTNSDRRRATLARISRATGLDTTNPDLQNLIDTTSHGGRLHVLWHDYPAAAVHLATPLTTAPSSAETPTPAGTVTFTGAHLLVIDHHTGNTQSVAVPPVTATWSAHRVTLHTQPNNHTETTSHTTSPTRHDHVSGYRLTRS